MMYAKGVWHENNKQYGQDSSIYKAHMENVNVKYLENVNVKYLIDTARKSHTINGVWSFEEIWRDVSVESIIRFYILPF